MEHYDILREDGSVSGNIMSNEQTHINNLLHRVVHIGLLIQTMKYSCKEQV